jgi:membrane protein insertase Oxa1/YidC/SpoIIIJ
MNFFNLLDTQVRFFNELHTIDLDFIGKFIGWLVGITGSVGIAIILFSLALKLVTLPFDVYQRVSMRKQNLKMKQNQARMEKLQKQYANDKETYNQKVMEMYKESGISMFSSCLPMILSMVIFFIAIGAFNSYAAHANVKNYNVLVNSYNAQVQEYALDLDDKDETTGEYLLKEQHVTYAISEDGLSVIYTVKGDRATDYLYFTANYTLQAGETKDTFAYDFEKAKEHIKASKIVGYYVNDEKITADPKLSAEIQTIADNFKKSAEEAGKPVTAQEALSLAKAEYFEDKAQTSVLTTYEENKKDTKFLWIKNIWVTDASYKHPVLGYSDFKNEIIERKSCSCSQDTSVREIPAYTEAGYKHVTEKLGAQKGQANGYLILIALSIGTILLQQFLSMRSQKEQQKYSSVDGQGAGQQKMMLVMMTGMFAIFSFMYSSAFSTYLIVSNLFSMASMFIINKCVDAKDKKAQTEKEMEKSQSHNTKRIEAAKEAGKKSAQQKRGVENTSKKKK